MASNYSYEDPKAVWAYEIDPVILGYHLKVYNKCTLLF